MFWSRLCWEAGSVRDLVLVEAGNVWELIILGSC